MDALKATFPIISLTILLNQSYSISSGKRPVQTKHTNPREMRPVVTDAADGTKMYETGMPEEDLLSITPEDTTLFMRQIAADNTPMVTNYSSWTPQVQQCV